MKNKIILLLSVLFIFGCTDDFGDINTDPTSSTEVPTSNLLTKAIQDMVTINSSLGYNKTMMFYVQQWSQRESTGRSRYGDIQRDWASWYLNGMPELYEIIKLNSGDTKDNFSAYGSNNNQIAVAKILRSWAFMNMTDAWGDIPYSEVGNPEISFPKYDKQSSIYPSLLAELKSAAGSIDSGDGVVGDLLFDGDMAKWKKFANSLRARIALRMSKVDNGKAKSEFESAINDGVIESNDDNAVVAFQEVEGYANPLYLEFLVQQWTYISDVLVDAMSVDTNNVDPRLAIYGDPAVSTGTVIGFPYGLPDDASTEIPQDDGSYPGAMVRSNTFGSILCTASEMEFAKAEAISMGWIAGDAGAAYNAAIKLNMGFWGVDDAAADAFIAAPHVAYDAAKSAELIGTQKWISLYTQGAQAWAEYRRIGYPMLAIPAEQVENGATQVPRRFYYPLEERNTNGDNLDGAISGMGGDDFNVHVWWDK